MIEALTPTPVFYGDVVVRRWRQNSVCSSAAPAILLAPASAYPQRGAGSTDPKRRPVSAADPTHRGHSGLKSADALEGQGCIYANGLGEPLEFEADRLVVDFKVRFEAQLVDSLRLNGDALVNCELFAADVQGAEQPRAIPVISDERCELKRRVRMHRDVEEVLRSQVGIALADAGADRLGMDSEQAAGISGVVDVKLALVAAVPAADRRTSPNMRVANPSSLCAGTTRQLPVRWEVATLSAWIAVMRLVSLIWT